MSASFSSLTDSKTSENQESDSRVGGVGNKGSSCPGRILSLSAFVTVCDSSEAEWRHYE